MYREEDIERVGGHGRPNPSLLRESFDSLEQQTISLIDWLNSLQSTDLAPQG